MSIEVWKQVCVTFADVNKHHGNMDRIKFSKGMRRQLFDKAAAQAGVRHVDNTEDVYSFLNGDEKPMEITRKAERWLDQHCSNGEDSRWTWIGNVIWSDACRLQNAMLRLAWAML